MKLPDQYVDVLLQVVGQEDDSILTTCEFLADTWVEMGDFIIKERKREEGWSELEAPGKAHAWFIETSAAHSGKHPTSMYDRMRVGRNIIHRGLHQGEWENLKFGHWCALMRNVDQDEQLVIPEATIADRLAWMARETDANQGQPPSVRDIQDEFRRNGKELEWELYWKSIVRNAGQLMKVEGTVPARVTQIAEWLLSTADAVSTGGTQSN